TATSARSTAASLAHAPAAAIRCIWSNSPRSPKPKSRNTPLMDCGRVRSCPPAGNYDDAPAPGPASGFEQLFGNLDGVESRALEELIAANPEAKAVFHCAIFADASDLAIVAFGHVERQRIFVFGRFVHQVQTRRFLQDFARRFHRDRLLEFGADRDGMRAI